MPISRVSAIDVVDGQQQRASASQEPYMRRYISSSSWTGLLFVPHLRSGSSIFSGMLETISGR